MSLEVRVRVLQILTGALVVGAVSTLLILALIRSLNPIPQADPPLVSFVLLGFTAVQLVAAWVVPGLIAAAGRRRLASLPEGKDTSADAGAWYALYHTCHVVRLAMLEGIALSLIIAYFVDSWTPPLLVAAVVIALMLLLFPGAARVARWVEAQKERAYQDRPLP
jgi:hypothetical protein